MTTSPENNGAGTIKKRDRRTNARIDQLDRQIIEVLESDHPQSVRHIFYRMTDPRLPEPVEKSDRGYRHVQNRCVVLRRSGRVPYGWFADMSRRGFYTHTFTSAADFIRAMQTAYRQDLWRDADVRCEVWVESRSIASVIFPDCKDLAVSLFPCGGFSSLSFVHDAAEELNGSEDRRPLQVLYVGDFDPAGVLIDVTLERELRNHLDPGIDLLFERVGINPDQIVEYDLPTKPRKAGDKRSLHVEHSVEAEAMPAGILRDLLRTRIESLLPPRALEVARTAEREERRTLVEMATLYEEGRI